MDNSLKNNIWLRYVFWTIVFMTIANSGVYLFGSQLVSFSSIEIVAAILHIIFSGVIVGSVLYWVRRLFDPKMDKGEVMAEAKHGFVRFLGWFFFLGSLISTIVIVFNLISTTSHFKEVYQSLGADIPAASLFLVNHPYSLAIFVITILIPLIFTL